MQIEQVDPELEVIREGVEIVVEGFRGFTLLAHQIMIAEGVGTDDGEGNLRLHKGAWLNFRRFLKALQRIEQEIGRQVLIDAGQTVIKYATFPPTLDIYTVFQSADIAYHMNHRKDGQPLFDPNTGVMKEGIGHHKFEGKVGDTRFTSTSDGPYPCAYDQGIMLGMAQRFKPNAQVTHAPGCRSKGGASCTYIISWK